MKIAFYAPMKPVNHPIPSGDRRIARLIIEALKLAGHEVEIASTLRSYDGVGDHDFQVQIQKKGLDEADKYVKNHKPSLWFTYHLYHKAPDWVGPTVAKNLNIPYVVAEASFAPKQKGGKWDLNHKSVELALQQCQQVYQLNPDDIPCIKSIISNTSRQISLPPFVDFNSFSSIDNDIVTIKNALSRQHGLNPSIPWIVVTAMMRNGDKLKSYEILSNSLKYLDNKFQILICGDGPARVNVEQYFINYNNIFYLGLQNQENLHKILYASEMFIWPGINEAFGLALLEAQAAGLPVIAGNNAGIANIIKNGETGILTPTGDAMAFAKAVKHLLDNPTQAREMGILAASNVKAHHNITTAAEIFARTLPNE